MILTRCILLRRLNLSRFAVGKKHVYIYIYIERERERVDFLVLNQLP